MKTLDEAVEKLIPKLSQVKPGDDEEINNRQHQFRFDLMENQVFKRLSEEFPLRVFTNTLVECGLEKAVTDLFFTGVSLGVSIGVEMEKEDDENINKKLNNKYKEGYEDGQKQGYFDGTGEEG